MEIDERGCSLAPPPVMSQAKFADLIGKEEKTVRSWVTTRAIPTVLVGGSRLIHFERLRSELAGGKYRFAAGDYGEEY
jgi:hypothetical protein